MMIDQAAVASEEETSTVLEHGDYRIRLRRTQVGWIGFVTRRGQRPSVILAPDRDALMTKAHAWIRGQTKAETRD